MAVKAKPVTHDLSHRSILNLDKSNEPFPTLIAEACDILGINLKEPSAYLFSKVDEEHVGSSNGPQEEWALRWLLKNLQSADIQPASPSFIPKAWLLLRELIVRTSLTNAARLLNAHKFTALLQKIFKWMGGQADPGTVQPNFPLSRDSDASSSDTIETSATERPKNSRKRKRDDQQADPSLQSTGDLGYLFASICSTIVQLQAMVNGPTRLRDFAIEHLKSAIRSSPEQAADILGSSMVLAGLIFDKENQSSRNLADSASSEDSDKQSQGIGPVAVVFEACIGCIVELWNSCSTSTEESAFHSKCLVFSVHCMVPTLRFIGIYRVLPHSSSKKEEISKDLKQLLVNNIILPARASYFAAQNRKETEAEAGATLSVETLLAPLAKVSNVNIRVASVRNVQALSIPAIPLLFSVAVHSLPRNTPRQRSLDDPWLRHLFSHLRNISFSNTMLQHKQHVSNLNCMLRGALKHRVRLDSTTLEAILAQVMNVANEDFNSPDAHTYWALINLCLRIDANVFISSFSADHTRNDIPAPNRYLNFLLLQLSGGSWKSSPRSDPNYHFKMMHVIQPLVKAYTNARDLTTFISHWREQIILRKQQQNTLAVDVSGHCNSETLWEDEELILQVGRMVEASLTTAQITELLRNISAKLPATHAAIQCDLRSTADLVILESIIRGLSKESNLDHLTGDAHSIYLSISSMLSGWAGDHRWRLWRILSIFNERWSLPRHSEAAKQADQLAMIKATDSISNAIIAGVEDVGIGFVTELHAFSFMLKRGPVRSVKSELDIHHISSAIQAILNSRKSAFDHVRLKVDWSRTPPEFLASWNAQNATLKSVDVLVIGCIAQILTSPSILRDLDIDTQRSFFTQLQIGALAFKNSGQATETGHINYLSLWELMLESEILKESTALSRLFRDLQASFYLEVSSTKVFDFKQYEIAFLSIQRAPVRAFERDKKNRIPCRILQILLEKCLPKFTLVEDHITLLNEYLSASHILQNLLISTKTKEVFEGETTGSPINRAPLISLAQKLDDELGTRFSSFVAFRRLVCHFFRDCASELSQNENLEYLAPFYDQLAEVGSSDTSYHLSYALSILIERSLDFYRTHFSRAFEWMTKKWDCLEGLRQSQCEKIRTEFSKIHEIKSLIDRKKLSIVLEGMFSYSDILSIESSGQEKALLQLWEISEQLYRPKVAEGSMNVGGDEFGSPDQLLVQITRVAARLRTAGQDPYQAVLETKKAIKKLKAPRERGKLLHHLQDMIAKHIKRDATLLKILRDSERGDSFPADYLLLLQHVILAGHKESKQETVDEYAVELDRTYSVLCEKLMLPTEYRICVLTVQCLNLLLQKEFFVLDTQPRIISQWHIDNTLAAIALLSSRLEQTIKTTDSMSNRPGIIFTSLCRIFSSMLISHRLKLGGRYHLILPALQGLLRCLFRPYHSLPNNSTTKLSPFSSSSSLSASSPSTSKSSIISSQHASLYSRLLTTLCSPTVSAVTVRPRSYYSSFSPSSLNDETKKARNIAGQHLQYLIMEYCTCQLWGHLTTATTTTTWTTLTTTTSAAAAGITKDDDDDDYYYYEDDDDTSDNSSNNNNNEGGIKMREKLMPGIFAVMDVMSAEVKRTVNARLDANGRSIFKGLYEEWRREWRRERG